MVSVLKASVKAVRSESGLDRTVEDPGKYACLTCTNRVRPCLIYDLKSRKIILLPLVEEARNGADSSQASYWVSDQSFCIIAKIGEFAEERS